MANTLWTPDRDVPLHVRTIQHASPQDMAAFRHMHEVAQKFGIALVCRKCDKSFEGLNGGNARTESVFCSCREIRAEVGGKIVRPPQGVF